MATVETKLLTAEEFFEWGNRPENEGRLWELDQGRIVEMPPPGEFHGVNCSFIVYLLWQYVIKHGQGYVCSNDTGLIVARDPDTVRGPDIMLFGERRTLEQMSRGFCEGVPQLVVEVLSPGDQMTKVNRRLSQILKRGVPLVWLVDPEVRSVTVYRSDRPGFIVYDDTEELTGEEVLPDLRIRVEELFNLPNQKPRTT
jgi:Uma2 family endonuclease